MNISFTLNGKDIEANVDPSKRLIDFLRDDLDLTGSKESCGEGECGACTVLIDNQAVNSCLILVGAISNKSILTIEGVTDKDKIQDTLVKHGAVQCGYCIPGFIMSTKALLLNNPHPTKQEIRVAISGNLCRCTGYENIVNGIMEISNNV